MNPDFDAVGWLKKKGINPSKLGEQVICAVASLIGDGRHKFLDHYEKSLTKKYRTDWDDDNRIRIVLDGDCLANHSDHGASGLFQLMFICNAMRINLHISGSSNGYLSLTFRREMKMPDKPDEPRRNWYYAPNEIRQMAFERFKYAGGTIQDMGFVPDCWKDL